MLSRAFRFLGRILRRITIGLGALILILHFFGDWIYARWPYPACSEWPKSSARNTRGDAAEFSVHGCIFGLFAREYRIRLRPADSSSAKLLVRFNAKKFPELHWLDNDRLLANLGEVTSLSPQIDQIGTVHVVFAYSGASPSLN